MLAGQAHEIEAQWHRATPASAARAARDAEHHRAAIEARAARESAARPGLRLGFRARLTASLRALAAGVSALLP